MKNLLIILKLLIMSVFLAQSPDTTKSKGMGPTQIPINSNEKTKLNSIIQESEKKIEEVKSIQSKNIKEILEIEKIEEKRQRLKNFNLNLVDKILHNKKSTSTPVKKQPVTVAKKALVVELSKIQTDSTCVAYGRNDIFAKKKCDKWEYTRYVIDSGNNRIIIK